MRSMTGYGRGVAEQGDVRATVDIRAVNHRFLDLKLRGAAVPPELEDAITAQVRGAIERGAVVVSIHLVRAGAPIGMRIDREAAGRAHRQLAELATQLAMQGPDLTLVLSQPGVVLADDAFDDRGDGATALAVTGALAAGLARLAAMRIAEGVALARDLAARLDELVAGRTRIAALAGELPALLRRRLTDRVKRLAAELGIDDARIAQEVAIYADRADVTEELVRLASHLDQARALLAGPDAVGRRLDFLVQEIGREVTTIGAKAVTAEISTAIVDAKATLEKVREQVQNIE
jgi:uncharacterized protein (TIGR00255 family)